jgi:oxepin-CoA hydrolase/3-oxo-5,6-dehydrosuberyl-CoA semialdehyde dehydrogenase
VPPILFRNDTPHQKLAVHDVECFGPVSTIMPYKDIDDAIKLARMGKGSLVSSIITADDKIATEYVVNAASMHGRILVLNERCAKESTGHGSPMPLLTHGGPGRAGGGEEMGGKRLRPSHNNSKLVQISQNLFSIHSESILKNSKLA